MTTTPFRPTASDLKSRLIVARENAETSRQEAETLRSRVDDLQARLENMQKLLSLKDDQLAQLQDRVVTEDLSSEETAAAAETGTLEPVERRYGRCRDRGGCRGIPHSGYSAADRS